MKAKKTFIIRLMILLAVLCIAEGYAYAASGSGDGANKEEGLYLVSCNIKNGQADVSTDTAITLEFNKNVVNMSVAGNNRSCFTLYDQGGEVVPIAVLMGDDQVDPTIKRIITVDPEGSLKGGMEYSLNISGKLMAKNGTAMGTPLKLTFKTKASDTAASGNIEPVDKEQDLSSTTVENKVSAVQDQAQNANENQKNSVDKQNGKFIFNASIGCIIAAFILLSIYLWRRKTKDV